MLEANEAREQSSDNNQTKDMLKEAKTMIEDGVAKGIYKASVVIPQGEKPSEDEIEVVVNILKTKGYTAEISRDFDGQPLNIVISWK